MIPSINANSLRLFTMSFEIRTDLGYPVFIDSNKKFITLFVRVFTKTDAMGPHFYKFS